MAVGVLYLAASAIAAMSERDATDDGTPGTGDAGGGGDDGSDDDSAGADDGSNDETGGEVAPGASMPPFGD